MNKLKELGSLILGWAVFIGFVTIGILFLKGGLSILPGFINVLYIIGGIAFLLCLTILPFLCIFKSTRGVAAIGFYIASYVFGLQTWLLGFVVTLSFWGWFGVIIGLFLAGIGVVPLGIIASLIHREWFLVGNLVLSLALTYGVRILGLWLAEKVDNNSNHIEVTATVIENDTIQIE